MATKLYTEGRVAICDGYLSLASNFYMKSIGIVEDVLFFYGNTKREFGFDGSDLQFIVMSDGPPYGFSISEDELDMLVSKEFPLLWVITDRREDGLIVHRSPKGAQVSPITREMIMFFARMDCSFLIENRLTDEELWSMYEVMG